MLMRGDLKQICLKSSLWTTKPRRTTTNEAMLEGGKKAESKISFQLVKASFVQTDRTSSALIHQRPWWSISALAKNQTPVRWVRLVLVIVCAH